KALYALVPSRADQEGFETARRAGSHSRTGKDLHAGDRPRMEGCGWQAVERIVSEEVYGRSCLGEIARSESLESSTSVGGQHRTAQAAFSRTVGSRALGTDDLGHELTGPQGSGHGG